MEVANLDVAVRTVSGNRLKQLRAAERIPAVIYGMNQDNKNLDVPEKQFTQLVMTHHKLFELHFESGEKEEAFLQDLQWDNLHDRILHVDFRRIELTKPINTVVPLNFVGHAKGLSRNGLFDAPLAELHVECLPSALPEEIKVVINDLDLGDTIHVSDLELPPGVKVENPSDELVCQVKVRGAAETEEEAEGIEGEELSEPEVIGKKGEGDEEGEE